MLLNGPHGTEASKASDCRTFFLTFKTALQVSFARQSQGGINPAALGIYSPGMGDQEVAGLLECRVPMPD